MIGLPFLPNYIDGQLKVKTRLSEHDELTVLGLAGFDNMKLNLDEEGEDAEYLLSYLPRIRQETFTVGAAWRHYAGRHVQTVSLGHTYLNNRNLKYRGNDDSSEDNLTLRLRSVEQKTTLRAENRSYLGRWTVREGAELSYSGYTNRTEQRLFTDEAALSDYRTRLGIVGWGLFAGADYASADKRFTATFGSRTFTGTYEFTGESHDIALHFEMSSKYDLGTLNGKTYLSGTDLQILFPATRLLKMVDVLGQKLASFSTTAATVSTLVGKFDDLYLGFEFTKQ